MLNDLAKEIHENAVSKGWWETERPFPEIIALCHSELSEALEEYRDGRPVSAIYFQGDKTGHDKPEGVPVELADCIIRILDYCGHKGINIDEVIRLKVNYNKTRTYRHGGKQA